MPITIAQHAYSNPFGSMEPMSETNIIISIICSSSCSLAVLITCLTAKKYPLKQADIAIKGKLGAKIFKGSIALSSCRIDILRKVENLNNINPIIELRIIPIYKHLIKENLTALNSFLAIESVTKRVTANDIPDVENVAEKK